MLDQLYAIMNPTKKLWIGTAVNTNVESACQIRPSTFAVVECTSQLYYNTLTTTNFLDFIFPDKRPRKFSLWKSTYHYRDQNRSFLIEMVRKVQLAAEKRSGWIQLHPTVRHAITPSFPGKEGGVFRYFLKVRGSFPNSCPLNCSPLSPSSTWLLLQTEQRLSKIEAKTEE